MKRIKKEIIQNMSPLEVTEGIDLIAHFTFPEDFIGFQGHFPVQKVLPGVCQIQCAIAILERWKKKKVALKEIIQAKFLSPVFPLEKTTYVCKNVGDIDRNHILTVSASGKKGRIAEFKLKVFFEADN